MVVTMTCPLCNRKVSKDLNITKNQVFRWLNNGELVQNVFPDLSPDDREFLMTGMCSNCQPEIFIGEEQEVFYG